MIQYSVNTQNPHRHFIAFRAEFPVNNRDRVHLQLPSWRPGRYELGNFAKNIRSWRVTNEDGSDLPFCKTTKDAWLVETEGADRVVLSYEYYAAELNAGSSFLNENQLYINPVNCFFYDQEYADAAYEVVLNVPSEYQVATGMKKLSNHVLHASSFDELADCPLMASATLRALHYEVEGVPFHIWIQGTVNLNESRLKQDFEAFTREQFKLFGDIPCREYHFLFHFVPYFLRHGVEHSNSTVITMGPAADFQQEHLYKDLLGISCHELFHTWNVKNIRPVEMLPYDFTRENYSETGYVYEGVTTYYGDSLLWRSGAFTDEDWMEVIEDHVQDYMGNHGRFNLSVAQSSLETWLDGYVAGIPWRKVSIYNEGFLIAMMCDLMLLQESKGGQSLDGVMKRMYDEFGKMQRGYSAADYWSLMKEAGYDFGHFVSSYVNGTADYMPAFRRALEYAGLELHDNPSGKWSETHAGLSLDESNLKVTVSGIVPNSPADRAGLWYGDEIVTIGGITPYKNAQQLLRMHGEKAEITLLRKGKQVSVLLAPDGSCWCVKYKCVRRDQLTPTQDMIWKKWKNG
jgi:predicted metalloprotease with PDZ domain